MMNILDDNGNKEFIINEKSGITNNTDIKFQSVKYLMEGETKPCVEKF